MDDATGITDLLFKDQLLIFSEDRFHTCLLVLAVKP
jgi:hypothetical protein